MLAWSATLPDGLSSPCFRSPPSSLSASPLLLLLRSCRLRFLLYSITCRAASDKKASVRDDRRIHTSVRTYMSKMVGIRRTGRGAGTNFMRSRSHMPIDPRIPTMPTRRAFHRPGKHRMGRGAGGVGGGYNRGKKNTETNHLGCNTYFCTPNLRRNLPWKHLYYSSLFSLYDSRQSFTTASR